MSRLERWPLRQRRLTNGKLGYIDFQRREVVIEQRQPLVGKHIIVLHELIHAVTQHCIEAKLIRRQPERFVESLAGGLLPMLALSGLWKGLRPADVRKFYKPARGTR